jgi:hypothetical protein
MFQPAFIIAELDKNKQVFHDLFSDLGREVYLYRPAAGKWCLLEILCHLLDEEREDFRARLRHILEHPHDQFTPIDPEGWVTQRNYAGNDFEATLGAFVQERDQSVWWLRSLIDPPWDNELEHPGLGPMSGKLFLSNWLAHDYLHLRQIAFTKHAFLKQQTGENLAYAGNW